MSLTKLNTDSYNGGSPAVWREDLAMLLVQGWRTDQHGIDLPAGEDVVRLPALLAVDAVVALDGDAMTFVDLMRMLRTFATSAFRLEARQLYTTDQETAAFAAWHTDGRIPDADDPLIRWLDGDHTCPHRRRGADAPGARGERAPDRICTVRADPAADL